jgi:hypothetical protein
MSKKEEIESELMAARQGFEPQYAAPEAAVLPLNERAIKRKFCGGKPVGSAMAGARRKEPTCSS